MNVNGSLFPSWGSFEGFGANVESFLKGIGNLLIQIVNFLGTLKDGAETVIEYLKDLPEILNSTLSTMPPAVYLGLSGMAATLILLAAVRWIT